MIHQASDMSMTRTTRIDDDLATNKYGDIKREEFDRSLSGGVDWTAKEMLAERDAQVKRMQEEIEALRNGHNTKESELKQLRKWHQGDQYLSGDAVLKDAIEDHRLKTMAVHEKEQQEISKAAYQTVKTLQDMIEQKNDQLKRKEENIERLRDQMRNQAESDAKVINQLRE